MVGSDNALTAGLSLGTTYILSVGPNNLLIIREGLVRGRVFLVSSLLLGSYILLLLASYALTDRLTGFSPGLALGLSWLGLSAMAGFSILSLRAALATKPQQDLWSIRQETRRTCLRRVTAITIANPLVYVEFILIPAGLCGTFKDAHHRIEFVGGLMMMAAVCCYGYALCGCMCATILRNGRALRVFDFACSFLMAYVTAATAFGLLTKAS